MAPAETPPGPAVPEDDPGTSLMEEGAKLFFRGFLSEMEPALDEMARAMDEIAPAIEEIGPQLRQLAEMVGDFKNYEAPVRLPNGDILIRRKPPSAPVPLIPLPGPNGEIEL
ncbi:MAG: hypothetical protein IAE87_18095 [Rhodobacteraceae bacterium]|nr:hypothetical protein [Paracoccaceae bacterium]